MKCPYCGYESTEENANVCNHCRAELPKKETVKHEEAKEQPLVPKKKTRS